MLEYAGVNVSKLCWNVHECSSISTLEWAWNNMPWGEKFEDGTVRDQAWFYEQVAATNKLEFLEWAREVKQCEWDKRTIIVAASFGNLEMLKYCFSNGCPCDGRRVVYIELLLKDTSTVFDFFSTKWNLRERRKKKRQCKQQDWSHRHREIFR